jgi:predicted ATPase
MFNPTEPDAAGIEADAATLERAAEVLKRQFGTLTAGDLINGLRSCTYLLRSGAGIIRPAAQEEPGHGHHEAGDYS